MQEVDHSTIAGVVVLFRPDLEKIRSLYESVRRQVDDLWFVDNTPDSDMNTFRLEFSESPWDINYLPQGDNLGIATAQNIGIRKALAKGSDHVLLLDQDSLLPEHAVARLLAAERSLLAEGKLVAAVGPVFIDSKTKLPGKIHHHQWFRLSKPFVNLDAKYPEETDWLIASGSLIRSSVLQQVGYMRDDLFIDAVDTEWGLRARNIGLLSYVVPTVCIDHSIGDSYIRLFGVSVIMHSELRNYYIARNWLYLLRVRSMGRYWRSGVIIRLAKFLLVHSWFTEDRFRMMKLFLQAIEDALRGRLGRYSTREKDRV